MPDSVDPLSPLAPEFFDRPAQVVAPDLLGRYLVRVVGGERLILRLVETEAYLGARDRASHAWNGRRTARNESLYAAPGHAYVYFVYGLHFCLNVVTAGEAGGAVLLRAGQAVAGAATMAVHRGLDGRPRPGALAGGPAKLCQALAVDREWDGRRFGEPGLGLAEGAPVSDEEVVAGPRVGIGYAREAIDWPLRFAVRGHPEVSRPRL